MALPSPLKARERAEQFFSNGLCCSESALLAIAHECNIDCACVPAVASGFCGGMARTGGPCGAVTGAVIAIGLALGRTSAEASGLPALQATNRLVTEFLELFRETDCHALVGFDPKGLPQDIDAAFAKEGRKERCARFTGVAAELAASIIQETRS